MTSVTVSTKPYYSFDIFVVSDLFRVPIIFVFTCTHSRMLANVGMKSLMLAMFRPVSPQIMNECTFQIKKALNNSLPFLFVDMSTSAVPETSLADFFPRTTKLCLKPSAAFFTCLSEKSVKSSDADIEAGARGLSQCLKEKKTYEACMLKNDVKINDPKRHRVREHRTVSHSHSLS